MKNVKDGGKIRSKKVKNLIKQLLNVLTKNIEIILENKKGIF
jgi:hypothetical protein